MMQEKKTFHYMLSIPTAASSFSQGTEPIETLFEP